MEKKCREKNLGLFDWLIMNIKDFMLVEWQIEIQSIGVMCIVVELQCPFTGYPFYLSIFTFIIEYNVCAPSSFFFFIQ
uniref:Uncharacterized protein n=1 Tax=Urocitellus parryii TaxID=9999 RepID=A0A8D2IDX1_UROPR